jgi:hypothetical protein
MSAEERITHQKNDCKYEHLHREQAQHRRGDGESGSLADVPRDLSELHSRQVNFLAGEMRSILGYFAEKLTHSAIRLGRYHVHLPAQRFPDQVTRSECDEQ